MNLGRVSAASYELDPSRAPTVRPVVACKGVTVLRGIMWRVEVARRLRVAVVGLHSSRRRVGGHWEKTDSTMKGRKVGRCMCRKRSAVGRRRKPYAGGADRLSGTQEVVGDS